MYLWAIQHKPTGRLLPQASTPRSGTWTDLDDKRPPRLFTREAAAVLCLRHWLNGKMTMRWVDDWESGKEGGGRVTEFFPTPERNAADMRVVPVKVKVDLGYEEYA